MDRFRVLAKLIVLCAMVAPMAVHVEADVRLPAVIGDNMVLQQGMAVPIWGWAAPGEDVTVTITGQKLRATAGDDGRWMVKLEPMKAGGPLELTVAGKNAIAVKNVLVGEVWYCAGQSNMEMTVKQSQDGDKEAAAAQHPEIRHFTLKKVASAEPVQDVDGAWAVCGPDTAGAFSAAAYFFARDVQAAMKVPVGVMNSSWGGSQAEAWMSDETLKAIPEAKPILDNWAKAMADWPKRKADYEKAHKKWEEDMATATAEGKPLG